MSKFNLSYLKPDKTVWHTLARVHVPPSNPLPVRLELRSSGRVNAEYTAAILKLDREQPIDGAPTTVAAIESSDARRIKLFARHVVVGWDEVRNEDGAPMPFSVRDVEDLLMAISIEQKRPDLVAPAIARAADPANFDEHPAGSAEALGKS